VVRNIEKGLGAELKELKKVVAAIPKLTLRKATDLVFSSRPTTRSHLLDQVIVIIKTTKLTFRNCTIEQVHAYVLAFRECGDIPTGAITIQHVESGSVSIALQMSSSTARQVFDAFLLRKLDVLDVASVTITDGKYVADRSPFADTDDDDDDDDELPKWEPIATFDFSMPDVLVELDIRRRNNRYGCKAFAICRPLQYLELSKQANLSDFPSFAAALTAAIEELLEQFPTHFDEAHDDIRQRFVLMRQILQSILVTSSTS
jgi:hypothetical protein